MATYLGRTGAIGLGEESTWGTAVASSVWRPLISGSLLRNVSRIPNTDLMAGAAMPRRHFTESEEAGGSIELLATYDNVGILVKAALGALATTGAGPYTHTYTMASTLPSLTMELIRGTATNSEAFEGCKVASITFECSAGSEMTISAEIIAETAAARSAASTPSFSSTETIVLHHQATAINFNSANYDLASFRLTLTNSIARRQLLGSKLTQEPLRSDFASVECAVTLEATDVLYTALHADTQGDAEITWSSGADSIVFTIQNAWISEASDPISGAGIVTQDVVFNGESDGTDHGLKIAITNAQSSGISN